MVAVDDGNRPRLVPGAAVAEPAVIAGAPAEQAAVAGLREQVESAAGVEAGDVGERAAGAVLRRRGPTAVAPATVGELADVVAAPGEHVSGIRECRAVVAAGADGNDVDEREAVGVDDPLRQAALGGAAVAELTIAVVAPAERVAVSVQGLAVVAAGGDGDDAFERAVAVFEHQPRAGAAGAGAIAKAT